jgi:hypothetical protein
MASEDLKRLVAAEVALGASTGELAERFDYTPRGMRKLVATESVQRLVAVEREALAETLDQYRAQLVDLGAVAIENIRRVVEDPRHPRNAEMSRWLLDRIAFPRAETLEAQVTAPPGPTQEEVRALTEAFETVRRLHEQHEQYRLPPIEQDPHLLPARTRGR